MTCVKARHADKYVALVQKFSRGLETFCGDYVAESTTKSELNERYRLNTRMFRVLRRQRTVHECMGVRI